MKKYFLNGIKWSAINNLLATGISILIPFYLVLYINPSELGKLAIVSILYGALNMFFRPAFGDARLQKGRAYDCKSLDRIEFTINFIKSIIVSLILYLSIDLLTFLYEEDFRNLIYILIVTNLISAFRSPRIYFLSKELKFKEANMLEIIPKIIGSLVSLFLAIYTKDISSILYGLMTSSLIRVITSQYYVPFSYKFSTRFKRLAGIYNFGLWIMIERLFKNLSQNTDKLVVSFVLDLHWLGIYQLSKSLAYKLFSFFTDISNYTMFPIFSKMNRNNVLSNQRIIMICIAFLVFGLFNLILLINLLPTIVTLLGDKWNNTLTYASYLAFAGLLSFLSSLISLNLLRAFGDAKTSGMIAIYKMIILTFLSVSLGYYLLLKGIIISVIITEIIILIISFYKLFGYLKLKRINNDS